MDPKWLFKEAKWEPGLINLDFMESVFSKQKETNEIRQNRSQQRLLWQQIINDFPQWFLGQEKAALSELLCEQAAPLNQEQTERQVGKLSLHCSAPTLESALLQRIHTHDNLLFKQLPWLVKARLKKLPGCSTALCTDFYWIYSGCIKVINVNNALLRD